MSLVKSPRMTAAKLAANRANALKSTGPRTRRGKARVTLNALKHGRYTSKFFRSHLLINREDVALYDWIYHQFCEKLRPVQKRNWRRLEVWAREAWCFLREGRREAVRTGGRLPRTSSVWCLLRVPTSMTGGFGTEPRYAVKSTNPYVTSRIRMSYLVGTRGVRLRFWTRRAPVTLGELQKHVLGRVLSQVAAELDPPAATSSGTFAAGEVMAAGPNPAATDGPMDGDRDSVPLAASEATQATGGGFPARDGQVNSPLQFRLRIPPAGGDIENPSFVCYR